MGGASGGECVNMFRVCGNKNVIARLGGSAGEGGEREVGGGRGGGGEGGGK
jgi:hypothetical protein